jgi:hypothetical protein
VVDDLDTRDVALVVKINDRLDVDLPEIRRLLPLVELDVPEIPVLIVARPFRCAAPRDSGRYRMAETACGLG